MAKTFKSKQVISTASAQKRLLTLWGACSAILFAVLIARSIGGIYGSEMNDAWAWFLPNIIPTLSLMITVAIVDLGAGTSERQSSVYLFHLAFWLSLIYLILLAFTILNPVPSNVNPIDMMKEANLWLGPIQGLASAILGAFFVKSKQAN